MSTSSILLMVTLSPVACVLFESLLWLVQPFVTWLLRRL